MQTVKQYSGYFIALVLAILLLNKCDDKPIDSRHLEDSITSSEKAIKALNKLIVSKDKAINDANAKIKHLEADLSKAKAKKDIVVAKVKKYDLTQLETYYKERTKSDSIKVINNTLAFNRDPLITIATELEECDYTAKELETTKYILSETKGIVMVKDTVIGLLKDSNDAYKDIRANDEKIKANLKQDVTNAKKKAFSKGLVGVGIGFLIGVILVN